MSTNLSKGTILAAATVASFMMFLDTTVVNVALRDIRARLGIDVAGQQWVVDGYTLTLASLLLGAGSISDRTGARRTFLIGLAIFTLTSLACGVANGLPMLIGARALQGIGGALILPSSLSLISRAYPGARERSHALAIWGAVGGGIALAAGPVLGGWLTGAFGWRSVFLVNVPVGLIVLSLAWRIRGELLPPPGRRPDWLGQITGIVALTALTFLFIEGQDAGFLTPVALAALVIALLAGAAFLRTEKHTPEPMLPLGLFRIREFSVSTVVGFAINFAFYGQLFFLSLYLQNRVGLSPAATGWKFVPETVAAPLFTTFVTRGLPRLPAQRALLLGVGMSATGLALLAFFGLRGSLLVDIPLMVAIGVGAGAPTFLVSVMLGSVPAEQSGLAAGTVSASRQVGGLLGVALLGGLVGHSPSDAGVRIALGLGAGVMAFSALLAATLRTQPAHAVDMGEALAESMA